MALQSIAAQAQDQNCEELFISEYVEGWGNNKALEIYNPTTETIDLSNYRVTRYSNGAYFPPPARQLYEVLSGTIEPKGTVVLILDKRDPDGEGMNAPIWDELEEIGNLPGNHFLTPNYDVSWAMYFNGDDAVALEKHPEGTIIDLIGKIGERPVNADGGFSNPTGGWTDVHPFSTGEGNFYTVDITLIRKKNVMRGVRTNPQFFNPSEEWDTTFVNDFSNLGSHECDCDEVTSLDESLKTVKANVKLFPNPSQDGYFNLSSNYLMENIQLYDLSGKRIGFETLFDKQSEINISHLSRGIYFVLVRFADKEIPSQTHKLIIR